MHKQRGFTLIELMIAVAVVGILTAIAYPSYVKYVQKSYRSEGIAMLADATARMERYYAQNNSYAASNLAAIGIGSSNTNSPTGKYTLSFSGTPTATTYTVQVVPQGSQATDSCGTMSVDQAGTRTSSTGATDCWK
jgi:type IV pilus assembly protein PilE